MSAPNHYIKLGNKEFTGWLATAIVVAFLLALVGLGAKMGWEARVSHVCEKPAA